MTPDLFGPRDVDNEDHLELLPHPVDNGTSASDVNQDEPADVVVLEPPTPTSGE